MKDRVSVQLDRPLPDPRGSDKDWVMTNDPRVIEAGRLIEELERSMDWPGCYHCDDRVPPDSAVRDIEFHQDGVYCSRECLEREKRDVEAWAAEMGDV